MPTLMSKLILRLVDEVTRPSRQVAQSVKRMMGDIQGASASNRAALRSMQGELAGAVGTVVAMGLALAKPIQASRELETGLTDIAIKANLSRKQTLLLGSAIKSLGPKVTQSAQEIAKGVDVLAGFGMDPAAAMKMIAPIGRAARAYHAEMTDMAKANFAVVDNLKVPADSAAKAIDVMAQAGKEGAFEIKDMAQYFPSLTAAANALGQSGVPAVADLAAALQITRKGAGTSAEAATNLQNVLQKMKSPQTVKAFAKEGVNLLRELELAAKKGMTPIEAIAEVTNKALKGDQSRLAYLFQDAEAQRGLRPLIQNLEEFRRIRKVAFEATGVAEKDYALWLQTAAGRNEQFKTSAKNVATELGDALMPALMGVQGVSAGWMDAISGLIHAQPVLTRALVGGVVGIAAWRVVTLGARFGTLQLKQAVLDTALAAQWTGKRFGDAGRFLAGPFVRANQRAAVQNRLMAMEIAAGGKVMARMTGPSMFARSLMTMIKPIRLIKFAFRGLLGATGIGLLLLAAGWIVEHWDGVTSFFTGFGRGFKKALGPIAPVLEPLVRLFKDVAGWVGRLIGVNSVNDWSAFGEKAGAAIGGVVNKLMDFVRWVTEATDKVGKFFKRAGEGYAAQSGVSAPSKPGERNKPAMSPILQGLATGGHARANRDVLVGEKGPEIFRPGRSGTVIPNRELNRSGGAGGGRGDFNLGGLTVISNASDPKAVADEVMRRFRMEYRRASGGMMGDLNLRGA